MGMANPLTNGSLGGFMAPPTAMPGAGTQGQAQPPGTGPSHADVQGTGSLTGLHNTPLHVASIVLLGLGVIVGLNLLGFRFAVDAGIGK